MVTFALDLLICSKLKDYFEDLFLFVIYSPFYSIKNWSKVNLVLSTGRIQFVRFFYFVWFCDKHSYQNIWMEYPQIKSFLSVCDLWSFKLFVRTTLPASKRETLSFLKILVKMWPHYYELDALQRPILDSVYQCIETRHHFSSCLLCRLNCCTFSSKYGL